MRAFISYSNIDKKIAGQVKTILNELGIDAFVAHDDINVSQEWKHRILQELSNSNIFIPILSAAFKESEWAPQEVGLAYGHDDILFIPLSVDDTIPFGFISHIQGERIWDEGVDRNLLIDPIINRFPHSIIPGLIKQLADVRGFRNAETLIQQLIPYFSEFDNDEIEAFIKASIRNRQIWDAGDCATEYLPKFLEMHRTNIAPNLRRALTYQLEHREYYRVPDVN